MRIFKYPAGVQFSMDLATFWVNNHWTIIFYAVMIGIILLFRKKIEWQVFGIGLYKTKVGLKLMEKLGVKYRGFVQLLGIVGIGIGFIGMIFILGNLVYGLWQLIFNPAAPGVVGLVLPGISLPGQTLKVPLVTGWIALFIVVVIHEFSHGVVSRAHNIPVKSSGLLIFGPIGGAFVEPDEKKLVKQPETTQYALFAAGPFSNIISAAIFLALGAFVFAPLLLAMTHPVGVEVSGVTPNFPAANASLKEGMVITSINSVPITDSETLSSEMDKVAPGEVVTLGIGGAPYAVKTIQNPADPASKKGYIGITLKSKREAIVSSLAWLVAFLNWFVYFIEWLVILSFGIGLANLLPLGPVDGGRMLQTAARQISGNTKRGDLWWKRISFITLAIILVLVFAPIIKALI
jgi:membrane-associated protease RseP (regulator of RpoE activity)